VTEDHRTVLTEALGELEELVTTPRRGRPNRYDARAVLISLGTLLRTEGPEACRSEVERARRTGEALGESWASAVLGELSLACAEHVHAVDPRYLDLPNYDFAYTLRARERLEARLVAAEALGHGAPTPLLDGVRRSDERLAPHLPKETS
jgi:hypothetical protein